VAIYNMFLADLLDKKKPEPKKKTKRGLDKSPTSGYDNLLKKPISQVLFMKKSKCDNLYFVSGFSF
jgi:hypothetical protein